MSLALMFILGLACGIGLMFCVANYPHEIIVKIKKKDTKIRYLKDMKAGDHGAKNEAK